MHPEKLGFEDCDLNSIFKAIDKETQTSDKPIIRDSEPTSKTYKLPLPRELEKPEEGVVKVFSFCRILQDPDCPKEITIVRESVTEEVHVHPNAGKSDARSNRYRYCKEIIKPYLKDYPPGCPDSEELLLRDAIDAVNEDFPEYPPCCEITDESDKTTKKPSKELPPKKSSSHTRSTKAPESPDRKVLVLCPDNDEPKICVQVDPALCCPPPPVCPPEPCEEEKPKKKPCVKKKSNADFKECPEKPKKSKKRTCQVLPPRPPKEPCLECPPLPPDCPPDPPVCPPKPPEDPPCTPPPPPCPPPPPVCPPPPPVCCPPPPPVCPPIRSNSPPKRSSSPPKRSNSPPKRSNSPPKRSNSPPKRSNSPPKPLAPPTPPDCPPKPPDCPPKPLCPPKPPDCPPKPPDCPPKPLCPPKPPDCPPKPLCPPKPPDCPPKPVCPPKPPDCPPLDLDPCSYNEDELRKGAIPKTDSKSRKLGWPSDKFGTTDNSGPPKKKSCISQILDSIQSKSDAETCTPKPKQKKMDEENDEMQKCRPRPKTPPPTIGIPVERCVSESKSDKKLCPPNRTPSNCDKKKCRGSKGDLRKVPSSPKCNIPINTSAISACQDGKPMKTAMDAHTETLATLKCAMEDFMCKVFRTTQDAVSMITAESAKQIEKFRKSGSSADCPPPKKVSNGNSREKLRRFSLVNVDSIVNEKDCKDPPDDDTMSPARLFNQLVSKVDSTISLISDSMNFDLPRPLKPPCFNDSSSKYDVPLVRPDNMPRDVENVIQTPGPSNMLTSLTTKIWSIFCDDESTESTENDMSKASSTNSSANSESEENLINKLID